MATCTLDWTTHTDPVWASLFERIEHSTLLQHPAYGRMVRLQQSLAARHALIQIDGETKGLLQLHEARLLGGLVSVMTLDRGPLWLEGHGTDTDWQAFLTTLRQAYPRGVMRRSRLMPEWPDSATARTILSDTGWQETEGHTPYETLWLDLTADEAALEANLKSRWRQSLRKADQSGLLVTMETGAAELALFLAVYEQQKAEKNYRGADGRYLARLCQSLGQEGWCLATARHKGDSQVPVAAALFIRHGLATTYQAAWTTSDGRTTQGAHACLWHGLLHLKAHGIRQLDLGGINQEGSSNLRLFKEGLGGTPVRLVGQYA